MVDWRGGRTRTENKGKGLLLYVNVGKVWEITRMGAHQRAKVKASTGLKRVSHTGSASVEEFLRPLLILAAAPLEYLTLFLRACLTANVAIITSTQIPYRGM